MITATPKGLLLRLPLFLLICGFAALAMLVPAIFAAMAGDHAPARAFFYAALLGLIFVTLIALAMGGRRSQRGTHGQLLALFATFVGLPLYLAVPLHEALHTTSFLNAYFDMVSALTTTGADIFSPQRRIPDAVHLWRAMVGWLGGMLMWIAASAILAPLSLGGFEVTSRGEPGRGESRVGRSGGVGIDSRERLLRVSGVLIPVYAGLTGVLWVCLLIAGGTPLIAITHAMSVMATSGISPVGGPEAGSSGIYGEALMAVFMLFALSRLTFSSDTTGRGGIRPDRDPEFRAGVLLVLAVTAILFMRHWLGAYEVAAGEELASALRALWGSLFTVLSFLTTTGFESALWDESQRWSGLSTPGLILMGLALIGGGVATTAGGVKLLRVFALYLNGVREMEKLVHPSSVSSVAPARRRIQSDGAYIAWIFFMLFALSLAVITVLLTGFGADFDEAIVLTIAALSTTGPLIQSAADDPIRLIEMGAPVKLTLCAAMVLGRLETLAIISLLTTGFLRD